MNRSDLKLLQKHYTDQKEFIQDGYYRLRKLSDSEYELSFSVAGHCGTTNYHPRIKLRLKGERIIPISIIDVEETPVFALNYSEETSENMEARLEKLKEQFLKAKNLQ